MRLVVVVEGVEVLVVCGGGGVLVVVVVGVVGGRGGGGRGAVGGRFERHQVVCGVEEARFGVGDGAVPCEVGAVFAHGGVRRGGEVARGGEG